MYITALNYFVIFKKKKFFSGSLGLDLAAMIKKVLYGIKYSAIPHERQQLYGRITVPIGRVSRKIN